MSEQPAFKQHTGPLSELSADVVAGMRLRELFEDRLRHDGRFDYYLQAIKDEVAKGVERERATKIVSDRFGRLAKSKEEQLYRQRLAEKVTLDNARKAESLRELRRLEGMKTDYDKALEGLPPVAPAGVELDWIRAHPAMSRLSRMEQNGEEEPWVRLTAADILKPKHGPAPSMGAVHGLQHWVNRPAEFFKSMLAEQKKGPTAKSGGASGEAEDEDGGLDELNALLGG